MTHAPTRLADLLDGEAAAARLAAAGLGAARAATAGRHAAACARALREAGVAAHVPAHAVVVPGRLEVLGKHTDYAGGRSLLAAAERGVVAVAVARADAGVVVRDVAGGLAARFDADPALVPVDGWANYPMTAVRRLARNFAAARAGMALAFTSDLPPAAGMSSSSALVVATSLAFMAVNRIADDPGYREAVASPEALAGYLATVENGEHFHTLAGDRGVGTHGGSEDHTAMLCARAGALVQYAFAPVRFERALPLPAGHGFVIAASGVRAEKTGAARERYNRAAALVREAATLWRTATGRDDRTIGAALDADPAAWPRLRAILAASRAAAFPADMLLARVEQFVAEDREIIPAAGAALARGDLLAFGAQADRSQALAERLLGNQVAETVHLARSARELGAAAASAFGAGFGGSVWALVAGDTAGDFAARWRADYVRRFPEHENDARFFRTGAGAPVVRV